jgi:WXG100 family type VII secretion target
MSRYASDGRGIMSGSVHANQDQLGAAARQCRQTSDELRSGLTRVVTQVEFLTAGSLTGATGAALQSVFAGLNTSLVEMSAALDETARILDRSSNAFASLDSEAARDITAAGRSAVLRALRPPDQPG